MMSIPLHGKLAAGRSAIIDDEDFALVSQYRWNAWERHRPGRSDGPYAQATIRLPNGRTTTIRMHSLIMGSPGVDHKNGDGLDNTRGNLRLATSVQNGANQRPNLGTSSAYKGVSWHRDRRKWQANIGVAGKQRYLGLFSDEEDAARAYDDAAREAFGEFALLNFPEAPDVAQLPMWESVRAAPNQKLTWELVRAMRADRTEGATLGALVAKYGISKSQAGSIVNGKSWLEVQAEAS